MRNVAGGQTPAQSGDPGDRNDSYRAVASDLKSLIAHVQTSIALIETAIASELPLGNQEIAGNVVVLDDVTPRYVRASVALEACNARLAAALHFLLDTRTSYHDTDGSAGYAQPARSIHRA
jgi:hypothetical protein